MKNNERKKRLHIMKNIRYKIVTGLSIFMMIFSTVVFAATSGTEALEKEKDQINSKKDQANEELKKIENKKNETEKEVKNLTSQISSYEQELKQLDSQIQKSNEEIAETTKELDELQNKIVESKKLLDQRLIIMYQNGGGSYLEMILKAESFSDFLSKYYAAEQIAICDQKLIKQVEEEKEEQEKLKQDLDEKLEGLQAIKNTRNATIDKLNKAKGEKQVEVNELNSEAKDLVKNINEYENQAKKLDAEIRRKEEENKAKFEAAKNEIEANKGPEATSKVNFIKPIVGYNVTTGLYYSTGEYHGAVDYSGPGIYGKPVRAVADGVAITVKSLTSSYGRYVLIKHFNGLYTLYAHGSALCVKEGDVVKQGQTIMYVGNSGNSTGPHLHFEVRTSSSYSSRVNPLKYLP